MIKKICIDWGNTICPITGEYSGPMIDWPEIFLYEGVKDALKTLQQNYDLFIATNAKDSNIDQINAVMERVECASFFTHIFTPGEIGMGKENPAYYDLIADKLGENPQNMLMIGDDYDLDIRNAVEAGFQTCLFNPELVGSHQMYLPLHQFEVSSWEEILTLIDIPRPNFAESISWLQREDGAFVLLQHVQSVAAIAYWFAVRLRQNGVMVDAVLTHRAGLLHDLDKLTPGRAAGEHGIAGAKMLSEMGYPEVAQIVGSHVIAEPDQIILKSKEAELVFFADKLVKHNQIVSVMERFDDLVERYPRNRKFRNKVEPFLMDMQKKLCAEIGISSEEMLDQIKSDLMGQKPH